MSSAAPPNIIMPPIPRPPQNPIEVTKNQPKSMTPSFLGSSMLPPAAAPTGQKKLLGQ